MSELQDMIIEGTRRNSGKPELYAAALELNLQFFLEHHGDVSQIPQGVATLYSVELQAAFKKHFDSFRT